MRIFTLLFVILFAGAAYSQSYIGAGNGMMKDTVGTLNAVTPETKDDGEKMQSIEEPQDQQERIYWEQKAREDKQWEKQKQIDDYRFDVPGP